MELPQGSDRNVSWSFYHFLHVKQAFHLKKKCSFPALKLNLVNAANLTAKRAGDNPWFT